MITIIKVLNSSVVLVNHNGQEMIALGKGVGYGKKEGQQITPSEVERMFYSISNDKVSTYIKYAETIPSIFFELTQSTVSYAEELLKVKLNNSVYFMLADHLQFAIERFEKGIQINNKVFWEIKTYYPNEFRIGNALLQKIEEELNVKLPEVEAANIAFHIINARQDHSQGLDSIKAAKMIRNILNIVKYSVNIDEAEGSIHLQRFITHIKFFVERILTLNMLDGNDLVLYEHLKQQYSDASKITDTISNYIEKKLLLLA